MRQFIKVSTGVIAISIICFCVSFVVTVKYIIEPRYKYMTDSGVLNEIKRLKTVIMEKEQNILKLEEQIELYETILDDEGQTP